MRLTTTVKGISAEINLGKKSILCGDNAEGKSAVTQSLSLAAWGAADDVAGRRNVKALDLILTLSVLRGAPGSEVVSTLDLPGVGISSYRAWRDDDEDGKTHKKHSGAMETPYQDATVLLMSNPEEGRAALFPIVAEITRDDVLLALEDSALQAKYLELVKPFKGTEAHIVGCVRGYLATRIKELETKENAVESVVKNAQPKESRPTVEALNAARLDVEASQAWDLHQKAAAAVDPYLAWNTEASRLSQGETEWAQYAMTMRQYLPPQDVMIAELEALLVTCGFMSQAAINGDIIDPFTDQSIPLAHFLARQEMLRGALDLRRARHAAASSSVQRQIQEAESNLAAIRQQLGHAKQQASEFLRVYQAPGKTQAQLAEYLANQAPPVRAAEDYAAISALEARWKIYTDAKKTLEESKERLEIYQKIDGILGAVVDNAVNSGCERFEMLVQQFMPYGLRFALQLRDPKGKPVFRVGVVDADGEIDVAACGFEWTALTVALACALCKDPERALVLVEEREIRPVHRAELMKAWSTFPGAVVMTTVDDAHAIPDVPGWERYTVKDKTVSLVEDALVVATVAPAVQVPVVMFETCDGDGVAIAPPAPATLPEFQKPVAVAPPSAPMPRVEAREADGVKRRGRPPALNADGTRKHPAKKGSAEVLKPVEVAPTVVYAPSQGIAARGFCCPLDGVECKGSMESGCPKPTRPSFCAVPKADMKTVVSLPMTAPQEYVEPEIN